MEVVVHSCGFFSYHSKFQPIFQLSVDFKDLSLRSLAVFKQFERAKKAAKPR